MPHRGAALATLLVLLAPLLAACDDRPGDGPAQPPAAEGSQDRAEAPERDGPVEYDPASCPQDAGGMVYVTLYGMVFRFPYEEPLMFRAVPPEEWSQVPPPADPTAPEGCPGHPIRASGLTLTYRYADMKADLRAPRAGRLDQLSIIGVSDMYWGTQLSDARLALGLCRADEAVEDLGNGLTRCQAEWAYAPRFVADPLTYVAPFGQLFVVNCYPPIRTAMICRVAYKIHRRINIVYKFDETNIPASDAIALDRGIRDRIAEVFVPELSRTPIGTPEELLKHLEQPLMQPRNRGNREGN